MTHVSDGDLLIYIYIYLYIVHPPQKKKIVLTLKKGHYLMLPYFLPCFALSLDEKASN